MLTTGHQLRAARSLIGMDQSDLADLAKVNVNTIRSMEASGAAPIAGRAATVQAVQRCLEAAGIDFLNHGQPGVRLKPGLPDHQKPIGPATDAFDAMHDAIEKDRTTQKSGRMASVKETGEEVPPEQWERFEKADKRPKR